MWVINLKQRSSGIRSIWWVEDHLVLTSRINIKAEWWSLSPSNEILTLHSQARRHWGLGRTAWTIFHNWKTMKYVQWVAKVVRHILSITGRTSRRLSPPFSNLSSGWSSCWATLLSCSRLSGAVTQSCYASRVLLVVLALIAPMLSNSLSPPQISQ